MVKNENKNFAYTTHRIGGTTYKIKVVFNESGTEKKCGRSGKSGRNPCRGRTREFKSAAGKC